MLLNASSHAKALNRRRSSRPSGGPLLSASESSATIIRSSSTTGVNIPHLPPESIFRATAANHLAVLAEITPFGKESSGAANDDQPRHQALYRAHSDGFNLEDGSNPHHDEGSNRGGNNLNVHSNGTSAPASNAGGTRGPSPMHAFDAFRGQGSDHYGSVDGYPVQTPSSEHPPSGTQSTGTVSPSHARTNSGL